MMVEILCSTLSGGVMPNEVGGIRFRGKNNRASQMFLAIDVAHFMSVAEFTARSRAAGVRVLTGGCVELGTDGLPFAPFTAVLRELVHELGTEGVAKLLPGGVTQLAQLGPGERHPGFVP